ncbi:apolipoprotein N-acyltransferase [Rarobacter incanus]
MVLSGVGGAVLSLAFPDPGWWPAAPLGLALLAAAVSGLTWWHAFGIGLTGVLVMYLFTIHWATLYLGLLPWFALSAAQAIVTAPFLAGMGWSLRLVKARSTRAPRGPLLRMIAAPIVVAVWWTAGEVATARWPYGGFSWATLAFSHADGPFALMASWISATGLSFFIAWLAGIAMVTGQFLVAKARGGRGPHPRSVAPPHGEVGWWWAAVGAAGAIVIGAAVLPAYPQTASGSLFVAAVQGNGPAGYFAARSRGDLLSAQVDATREYAAPGAQVIIWPEDGTDLDPTASAKALAEVRALASEFDAPIVVGTIMERAGLFYNSSQVWEQGSVTPSATYDKMHPVPFGEYVPDRGFYSRIVPKLIAMIARDYQPGQASNVFTVAGARAGTALCFDVAYDDVNQQAIRDGAQVLFVQSNNADFGRTDESIQQLDIARIRAIEAGRYLVNISTVGTSAVISSKGSIEQELPTHVAGALNAQVTLYDGTTLGIRVGPFVSAALLIIAAIASAGILGASLLRRRVAVA